MSATEEAYPIARRWFEAKARLLGLDKLQLADQYAPIGEARAFSWPEAVEIVDTSFARFSPRLAEIFRGCLEAGHVDVLPRPGKAAGAYCTSVSKAVLPYVLMNYTERLRDVSTLAHEFGHATHNVLSLEQQTWRSLAPLALRLPPNHQRQRDQPRHSPENEKPGWISSGQSS